MKKAFLVVPSQQIEKKHFDRSKKRLKSLGYEIKYRKDIMAHGEYHAGSITRRVFELNQAFSSKTDIVFCVRGGFSSMELLPHLDWAHIKKSKKPFVGFSDITALHMGLYKKGYKGALIHAPNSGSFNWCHDKEYLDLLAQCIEGGAYTLELPSSIRFHNKKKFKGELVGGNLEIITRLIGTKFDVDFKGKVLFLEDVFAEPIQVYTKLVQMQMAGKLKGIKALLLGRMTECGDYITKLEEFIDTLKIPVVYELPIGHEVGMWPLRIGSQVTFDSDSLSFD